MIDEKAIVNGIVGLHATGGSTNHTIHLVAIARAAGIDLTWDDFADLSEVVPLLARIYPNGVADVNHFHAAGGMGFLIRELLDAGLLHDDVKTVWGRGFGPIPVGAEARRGGNADLRAGARRERHDRAARRRRAVPGDGRPEAADRQSRPGGDQGLGGEAEHQVIEAPARVFHSQEELQKAFKAGELTGDMVAVVRFQGPQANGMPELHKLTPPLGVLQDRGLKVALVTDGRMSGASGKVPAAIHVTPEAMEGGAIGKIRDGDLIRLDAVAGRLDVACAKPTERTPTVPKQVSRPRRRVLSAANSCPGFRDPAPPADLGASIFD